jgi:hypothetical protein
VFASSVPPQKPRAKSGKTPPAAPRPVAAGRARRLRWTLAVIADIIIVAAAVTFWRIHHSHQTQPADSPSQSIAAASLPSIPFTDITASSGLHFTHTNGAAGEKLLPETMGGGCAFFDYDNDGFPDILLINSRPWNVTAAPAPTMALYHNDGHGHFTDVTAGSGLDITLYGMGVAIGDYDNDGLPDVLITAVGGCRLFHNDGNGHFTDVTATAGVGGDAADWSTSAAFIDIDNDGLLDLFVCNYVQWDRQRDVSQGFTIPGVGRAYGPPRAFAGTFCRLYHNDGNGHFTDISEKAGIRVADRVTNKPAAKALAVAPIDLDGDGLIDLVVANDTTPNLVFHNRGHGTFEEIGARSGLAYSAAGEARGAMGIDAALFHSDEEGESMAVAVGNFAEELNALYVSQGARRAILFQDEAMASGVGPATRHVLTFGLFFFDADLDGRLDLLMVNGHLEPQIDQLPNQPQRYRQAPILLWNTGTGRATPKFTPLTARECGSAFFEPLVARGAAYADIDGDGDLDLLITQLAGPPRLYRNDQALGHHWLRLKLIGDPAKHVNRDAIGAWVEVDIGSQHIRRQVMPTCSYMSQVELPVTIGLGKAVRPDRVTVVWPNGQRQEVGEYKVDGVTKVEQR